jgi:hypothetical protein
MIYNVPSYASALEVNTTQGGVLTLERRTEMCEPGEGLSIYVSDEAWTILLNGTIGIVLAIIVIWVLF